MEIQKGLSITMDYLIYRRGLKIMKGKLTELKALNIFALIAMVTVNVLAQVLPLGGMTTAEISDLYPTLLTPIGLSFSIWSLIYIAMGWFVIQQVIASDDSATKRVGGLFAITCALNIAWIFSWHYQVMILAVVSIAALWVALLMIDNRLENEKWHLRSGFTIYFAWITAATAIQIFSYLSAMLPIRYGSPLSIGITVAAMLILTVFALEKMLLEKNILFGLTIGWVSLGIFLSQIKAGAEASFTRVKIVSIISLSLILLSCVWAITKMRDKQKMIEADI